MTTQSSIYTPQELTALGIRFGQDVSVHRTVEFFGSNVSLGSHVRIDCHCVITSKEPVIIGNYVHLGVGVLIFGAAGVVLEDFCGLSPRVSLFTTSDDYSQGYLANPTVPDKFKKVLSAPVKLERHAMIGCGTIVMPGVTIHRGASVGALSFVNRSVPSFVIVSGSPLRKIGLRNKERLEALVAQFEAEAPSSTGF
jgi:dTDP-4-amino-4,6-dideoxy-D-glucose acyltransferase